MTQLDPIKAATEELTGMQDAWKVLHGMLRHAERRAAEAEVELNSLLKVRAVVGSIIDDQTTRLQLLRTEAERKAKEGGRVGVTVLHREPLTAIRVCEACGQPLRGQRGGVFLSPLKSAIWDAIAMSGDEGVSVADIMRLDVWRDRKRVKPVTVRMHIYQMRDALAETRWRIASLDRRYVLVRVAQASEDA